MPWFPKIMIHKIQFLFSYHGPTWRTYFGRANTLLNRQSRSFSVPRVSRISKPSRDMAANYDPAIVEKGWYEWWENQGFFKLDATVNSSGSSQSASKLFTMITPPPNITGSLHIGHALTFSIEDAIIRHRRMAGHKVLYIPGTDHAGIGTQSVVENHLMKEFKLTRHDLGRDAFVREIWKWRDRYGDRILQQMRRLALSADFSQTFFTMDPLRTQAVTSAFVRLWRDGLIYRDERTVNWCPALETAISDIEVDYDEIHGRTFIQLPNRSTPIEFGVLHYFAYHIHNPTSDALTELVVATTRVETMLGDTAVAVHPQDERYKSLHGKEVIHPILGKRIPIVYDEELVNMEVGTGVVKVTPAHDPNDYTCARRHGLHILKIFDKDGTLNVNCGVPELTKTDRFDARSIIIERLKQLGVYRGADFTHVMRLGRCSKSGDVIEPMVQPQWFIRCKELAAGAMSDVLEEKIRIFPSYHVNEWERWLSSIQDWCISRQLWWGHRIPAYRLITTGLTEEKWFVASTREEAELQAVNFMQQSDISTKAPFHLKQDEDVLDTWFSSSLLPLSAFGWVDGSNVPVEYPTGLLETGSDILFFWVARMAMLCRYFTGKTVPFKDVYLHAMIRDAQGRKMSKSLGNVIDPLHVIDGVDFNVLKEDLTKSNLPQAEIKRSIELMKNQYSKGIKACGTDALRFALIAYTRQVRQINLDISNVISIVHFNNKLWNLLKFSLSKLESFSHKYSFLPERNHLSLVDQYILSRLSETVLKSQKAFETYELFQATDAIRRFVVEDLCDVYLEFSKSVLNFGKEQEKKSTLDVLTFCLDTSLRLAHPFMPFVTEELWQKLQSYIDFKNISTTPPSLVVARYPEISSFEHWSNLQVESDFNVILSVIHAARSLRQTNYININRQLPFIIWTDDPSLFAELGPLKRHQADIQNFIRGTSVQIVHPDLLTCQLELMNILKNSAVKIISPHLRVYVDMPSILKAQNTTESNIEPQIKKLNEKISKTIDDIISLEDRMNKPEYVSRVPNEVKEKNNKKMAMLLEERHKLESNLKLLEESQ